MRNKIEEIVGFIRSDGLDALNTLPIYGRLNTYYVDYKNNIYMYTPRRRRVGPRGATTWPGVPRRIHVGPARNLNPFFIFFILKRL